MTTTETFQKFDLFMEAAEFARYPSPRDDLRLLVDAVQSSENLRGDTYVAAQRQKFESLPAVEQSLPGAKNDLRAAELYCGKPEVYLSLVLCAHEVLPRARALLKTDHVALEDPTMRDKISARFPEMSSKKIENILAL